MADLIDRQQLLQHLNECIISHGIAHSPLIDAVLIAIKCAVEQMPTVEPKRGEWSTIGLCSVCNSEAPYNESGFWYGSNYCPNCGADMRGEEDD